MASTPGIVLNGAVSQYDRWLRALDPDYAQVDGRTYAELLDFSIQYAELIRFYNLSNEPEGNWVEFFLLDPVMVLAGLATIDVKSLEAEYDVLERKTAAERDYEKKFELLRATFAYILGLARQINAWLSVVQRIEQTPAVAQLDNALVQAINDSLRDALRTLKAYDEGAGLPEALGTPIGLDYSGFLPVWNLGCVCPDGSIYRGRTRQRKIDSALPHLEPLFYAFWDAIVDSQAMAGAALQSLLFTGDHKPQIALYMTFVQLFSTAQRTINTMSNRYADFYYRRVLRESPSGPLPDNVYLTFTLATEEGVDRATVPAATLFPAGQDAA
ncbi:MAG TPA: hypothetical protein VHK90_04110, partial [Thermoanaerobaculia bacterium]|nr:hypothetical protein [Thermoanaerobaculia bacterium]